MAGSADTVKIRVRPDLTGFDTEIRRTTDKKRQTIVEARLNAERLEAELTKLRADKTYIDIEARTESARMKVATLKEYLTDITQVQKIRIEGEIEQAKHNLAALQKELKDATGDRKIKITADITEANQRLADLDRELGATKNLKATLDVDLRTARRELKELEGDLAVVVQAEADTRKAQDQIEDLEQTIELKADLDAAHAREQMVILARNRYVTLIARLRSSEAARQLKQLVQGLSGFTMIQNWQRALTNLLANLPQTILKLTALLPIFTGLASVAMTAVAAVGPLASSLAAIAPGALFAAPALGALAASIGVVVAAFKDIDADDVSASTRVFSNTLDHVKDQLHDLRLGIQDAFFVDGNFTSGFERLVDNLLPAAREGLIGLSTEISAMGVTMMDAFTNSLSGGDLASFFANVQAGARASSDGFASIVTALTRLGTEGSAVLPEVGAWITRVGAAFNQWTIDADIAALLREAATQAGYLRQVLSNLGGIIAGVFRAMSSSSTGLESMAESLGKVREAVNSPAFQEALSTIFSGATLGASYFREGLGHLGQAIEALAPLISRILQVGSGMLRDMLAGLSQAISSPIAQNGIRDALAGIESVAAHIPWDIIGTSLGMIGSLMGSLSPVVTSLLAALGPLLPPILAVVQQLVDALIPIIEILLPPLADLLESLLPIISALLVPMGEWWKVLSDLLAPALERITEIINDYVVPAIEWIAGIMSDVVALIKDIIAGDWDAAWAKAQEIVGKCVEKLAELWEWVKGKASEIWGALKEEVIQFFTDLWDTAQQLWQDGVDWIVGIVQDLVDKVTGFFNDLWHGVIDPIVKMWTEATDWFINGDWTISGLVSGLIEKIVTFFKSLPGNVMTFVSDMWGKVKTTTVSSVEAVTGFVRGLVTSVVTFFATLGINIATKVKEIWDSTVQGFQTGINNVITWVSGLPGRIVSALGNLGLTLYSAGRSIIQGFLDGLVAAFQSVKDFIGGIAGWIFAHKGPLDYDYKLLQPAGNKIMGGFYDSLEAGMKDVESLVSGFAPDLASTIDVNQTLNTSTGEQPGGRVEELLTGILSELKATPEVSERQLGKAIGRLVYPTMQQMQGDDRAVLAKGGVSRL